MPVVYRCGRCGCILYEFHYGDPRGVPTPSELLERIGGRCPCCGARLAARPSRIRIRAPGGLEAEWRRGGG